MDGRAQFAPRVRELVEGVVDLAKDPEAQGGLATSTTVNAAVAFLLTQTTSDAPFPISERVLDLRNDFFEHLRRNEAEDAFNQSLDRLGDAKPDCEATHAPQLGVCLHRSMRRIGR